MIKNFCLRQRSFSGTAFKVKAGCVEKVAKSKKQNENQRNQ